MAKNEFTEDEVLDWNTQWREYASETVGGRRLRFLVMPCKRGVAYKVTYGDDMLCIGQDFKMAYGVYQEVEG